MQNGKYYEIGDVLQIPDGTYWIVSSYEDNNRTVVVQSRSNPKVFKKANESVLMNNSVIMKFSSNISNTLERTQAVRREIPLKDHPMNQNNVVDLKKRSNVINFNDYKLKKSFNKLS